MSSTSAVAVLAQGLRDLRDFAEGPDGEELRERTGLTAGQIEAALAGERLPPREVTLALVAAWEGDVEAWREYWGQIAELAEEDEGSKTDPAPAPPEPSIITPMVETEAASADAGPAGTVEADDAKADDAEAEAARARSAARAQLEANAQAAKAQSEARAAAEAAAAQASTQNEDADAEAAGTKSAAEAQAAGAQGAATSDEAAATRAGDSAAAQASARGKTPDTAAAKHEPMPAAAATRGNDADAADKASAAARSEPHSAPSTAKPTEPAPAKRSLLTRVGVPILVFAVGVGVGAFGDHALRSKQSSAVTAASLPPVGATSRSSHTAALVPSSSAATSSSGGADTPSSAPSATDGSSSASTSSTIAPGSVLGAYVGIQLASGYSVNFLADPYHPAAGTANGPDTMGFFASSFVEGRFYADRVAILDPTDTGSYTSCLNDTRYQHDVLLSQISTGSSFCITTGTGHLVLVTVRRLPSSTDANPYAVLDVTVWQSS